MPLCFPGAESGGGHESNSGRAHRTEAAAHQSRARVMLRIPASRGNHARSCMPRERLLAREMWGSWKVRSAKTASRA